MAAGTLAWSPLNAGVSAAGISVRSTPSTTVSLAWSLGGVDEFDAGPLAWPVPRLEPSSGTVLAADSEFWAVLAEPAGGGTTAWSPPSAGEPINGPTTWSPPSATDSTGELTGGAATSSPPNTGVTGAGTMTWSPPTAADPLTGGTNVWLPPNADGSAGATLSGVLPVAELSATCIVPRSSPAADGAVAAPS